MIQYPTISVVTPSYNQAEFLPAAIESVLGQEGDFFLDYIVMDGGSTDGSVEIMERYDAMLRRGEWEVRCRGIDFRFTSARDGGQADAVNKGFARARGDILGWLNSDDTYLPGALQTAADHFRGAPESVMLYGNAWYTGRDGAITGRYRSEPFDLDRLAVRSIICQPSVFLRRDAVREIGGLDASLHTCLDFDLWIRMGKRFAGGISFTETYLATSRMYAQTKTASQRDHVYRETMAVARRHYGYVPGVWIVHSVLEVLQATDRSFPEKAATILTRRLFPLRHLLQPRTLLSVMSFLFSRLAKSPHADESHP